MNKEQTYGSGRSLKEMGCPSEISIPIGRRIQHVRGCGISGTPSWHNTSDPVCKSFVGSAEVWIRLAVRNSDSEGSRKAVSVQKGDCIKSS